jgi:hypothetical protein
VVSGKRLLLYAHRLKPLACFGEFDLDRVLGGLGGKDTQKRAGLELSSELTFPLLVGRQRASDQLRNCETGALDRSP